MVCNTDCFSCNKPDCVWNMKHLTNYDRLVNKSQEELADWMLDLMTGWCPKQTSDCTELCKECLLDWLKQEAK